MAEAIPPPLGTLVRTRVEGWREAQIENANPFPDPAVPSLEGVPEFVEGELDGFQVGTPDCAHGYFKYIIADFDVEPESIIVLKPGH